ncbi:MAG: SPASM domain-containing protein, partial [Chloroflexi bacterium]|nr:SPASM domain-containing protein [Chloroflexota bacterium]
DKTGLQNLPVMEKEGCSTCEWRHWCAGGCSLATYRSTGRYDVKSPNCNIYKSVFPEALKLEGLRILKYANKLL